MLSYSGHISVFNQPKQDFVRAMDLCVFRTRKHLMSWYFHVPPKTLQSRYHLSELLAKFSSAMQRSVNNYIDKAVLQVLIDGVSVCKI